MATHGTLAGEIAWVGEGDPAPALLHVIAVGVLELHAIRFGVQSWRDLQGREFSFPNVVATMYEDGEAFPIYDIEGTLKVGDEYEDALPRRIRYGAAAGLTIPVHITGEAVEVEAVLAVGPVAVVGAGDETGDVPDLTEAVEIADRLLRRADYDDPVVDDEGCVSFAPRPV